MTFLLIMLGLIWTIFGPIVVANYLRGKDVYKLPVATQAFLVLAGGPVLWALFVMSFFV